MAKEGRSIIGMIFRNFINSFRPKHIQQGTLVGTDNMGNKYFEIKADPQGGKRKDTRWFKPTDSDNFTQEIPPEWESWLRDRRSQPPTEEELTRNYELMQLKQKRGKEIEDRSAHERSVKGIELQKPEKGMESFPTYDEYELYPGKSVNSNKK